MTQFKCSFICLYLVYSCIHSLICLFIHYEILLLNDTGCSRQALVIGGQLLGLIEETLDPVSLGSCVGVFERATLAVNKQREGGPVMGQSVYGGSVAGNGLH